MYKYIFNTLELKISASLYVKHLDTYLLLIFCFNYDFAFFD